MKNNFRFIFPRLIGATLLVGIAALVMSIIFKLMLGIILIGGLVIMAKRLIFKSNQRMEEGIYERHYYGGVSPLQYQYQSVNQQPANGHPFQKSATIVPID